MQSLVNPDHNAVIAQIWDKAFDSATNSWDNQRRAFKEWLNVDPNLWKKVINLTEARNAVAHGFGSLTQKQQRHRESTRSKLKEHSIALVGDHVFLTEEAIGEAADTCRTFILKIDQGINNSP